MAEEVAKSGFRVIESSKRGQEDHCAHVCIKAAPSLMGGVLKEHRVSPTQPEDVAEVICLCGRSEVLNPALNVFHFLTLSGHPSERTHDPPYPSRTIPRAQASASSRTGAMTSRLPATR